MRKPITSRRDRHGRTRLIPVTPCGRWRSSTATAVKWLLLACMLASTGCSVPRACGSLGIVASELQCRTSHSPLTNVCPGEVVLPPDVALDDGVTEDEAIATALSNNSLFQATLAQLGMAQGDLIQAGLLANPSYISLFPISVKQWEWILYVPIDAFVLRPHRLEIAQNDYQRVAGQLVQNGLTLVRDVRLAHADLALAVAQYELSLEAVQIRQGIADLTTRRLERGDIASLEAMTANIDALNSRANAALLEQNVELTRSRLATLMGLPFATEEISAELVPSPQLPELDVQGLIEQALASRPDMRAAQWAVDAAAARSRLSRWLFLRVDAAADYNSKGEKGAEAGPAVRLDLPIFNLNQGGVLRARAELQQAQHTRDAVRDQIVQDVRTAVAQVQQARNNLAILQARVIPSLNEAMQIARKGYEDGGAPYLLVLQATSQYVDARSRVLDQTAALNRARAELERSVARRITAPPDSLPDSLELLPKPLELRRIPPEPDSQMVVSE